MGTTRIKVIDLSSAEKEIKTARKHAEKLAGVAKLKEEPKVTKEPKHPKEPAAKVASVTQTEPEQKVEQPKTEKSVKKPKTTTVQKHHLGKKYQKAKGLLDQNKLYPINEALALLSQTSITKFDASVETHINVADKKIQGKVKLPHPPADQKTQKKKYLIFSDKPQTINDQQIIWGNEKTVDEIAQGKLKPKRDFNFVIATPKFMPKLATIAKILGPLGLMPNPKNGTIIENIEGAFNTPSDESIEFRSDPTAPIIHFKLGKVSTKPEELEENLKALYLAIGPTKVKKMVVTTTMGPGIKIDPSTITAPTS